MEPKKEIKKKDECELRNELLSLIRQIGKEKADSFVFDLNKLLERWERRPESQPFKTYGFGKLTTFLKAKCGASNPGGGKEFCIPKKVTPKSDTSVEQQEDKCEATPTPSDGAPDPRANPTKHKIRERQTKSKDFATSQAQPESQAAAKSSQLFDIKFNVFTTFQDLLDSDKYKRKGEIFVSLDELHGCWQSKHSNEKFKSYNFGSFKDFLIHHCEIHLDKKSSKFHIVRMKVEKELDQFKARKIGLNNAEIVDPDHYLQESKDQGNSHTTCGKKSEKITAEGSVEKDCDFSSKATTSHTDKSVKTSADSPGKVSEDSSDDESSSNEDSLATYDTTPEHRLRQSQRNHIQISSVLVQNGLDMLRNLFTKIHPTWKNSKEDLKTFSKGQLKLDSREEPKFKTGDIWEWDISLLAKVLLFSTKSSNMLKNDPDLQGCEAAIKTIRKIKNEFVSHSSSNEMTENAFKKTVQELKKSLMTLGLEEQNFESALKDADLNKDDEFYKSHLNEVRNVAKNQRKGDKKLDEALELLKKLDKEAVLQSEIPKQEAVKNNTLRWDEWIKVKAALGNLDTDHYQYILIADRMESVEKKYVKILADVQWKIVLDLDPNSDIDGFLAHCSPGETEGGVVETHTPSKLSNPDKDTPADPKRMQWVFVNGRNNESSSDESSSQYESYDKPKTTQREWTKKFKTPIQAFIRACSEKLDARKPTFCLILNIRNDVNTVIADEVIRDIDGWFDFKGFKMHYISFSLEVDLEDLSREPFISPLPEKWFLIGLHHLLGKKTEKYQLPSQQAGLLVPLPCRTYIYLIEYMDILYAGCEGIPDELSDKDMKVFKDKHLKSFLVGNPITFESLYFQHDAARNLTKDISRKITTMPEKFSKSQIVQITHAPGSGGTTIARRTIWDLRKDFPCAIVKMDSAFDSFGSDSDGEKFIESLCLRIGVLEELCELWPVILIDGHSRSVRIVSDHLVRKLHAKGQKAVILRCVNYLECVKENDKYFHAEFQFNVNPHLKEDSGDYEEFKLKYRKYCKKFQKSEEKVKLSTTERVFHFPMMAMLDEFDLKGIVYESLENLRKARPLDYGVAVLVAFLQIYSNRSTPAAIVATYLQKDCTTYAEISNEFSESLLNLMVSEKAPRKEKFISSRCNVFEDDDDEGSDDEGDQSEKEHNIKAYTFQHQKVAELVIEHSERKLDHITQDFLNTKILDNYQKNEFKPVIDNLFLYNKENSEEHFSLLINKLAKERNCGRIFEEAARKVKDVTFFSHAARYFVYKKKKPDFEKARSLIKDGLDMKKQSSLKKVRGVLNTEGYIVLNEMKREEDEMITCIEGLTKCAKEALALFRKARDNPPRLYPNPLLGEVNVWLFCFGWMIKYMKNDAEKAITYILEDKEFFNDSISECFMLLNEVDTIVQTVSKLIDPAYTMKKANDLRANLMQLIGRTKSKSKREFAILSMNIPRICEELSSKHFKTASEKEIVRLRALWMINHQVEKKIHLLSSRDRQKLLSWLLKLVKDYGMLKHAHDLMEVAAIQSSPPFDLDEALRIVEQWQRDLPNDAFSHFYKYVLCFISVCKSARLEDPASIEFAMKTCTNLTQNNPRRNQQQYFIRKDGEKGSICALISRSELEAKYADSQRNDDRCTARRTDDLGPNFWDKHCRDYLFECRGRIYVSRPPSGRGKEQPFILMEPGNVKVFVPRNVVGTANLHFRPDSRVTFVVCFTLAGPKALSIRNIDDREKDGKVNKYSGRKSQ